MLLVRRAAAAVVLGSLVVASVGSLPTDAQEPAATAPASKSVSTPPPARKKGEATRRVPDYFGQIGLTPDQKADIYGVVDKHMLKIEALEKQIEAHKAEMLAECETKLDDTQKKLLAKLRAASAPAGSAAKAAATSPKPSN